MSAARLCDADVLAAQSFLDSIQRDDDGFYTSSPFDELFGAAHVLWATDRAHGFPHRHLIAATEQFGHLTTLALKVAWLAEQRSSGRLDEITWMRFCGSDIVTFHIVMRSLFDEVSAMACRLAAKKRVAPDDFRRLQKWLDKKGSHETQLGVELADAVRSCTWFEELRELRDDLVHRSAEALVFLEPGRILFQVHVGSDRRILMPAVMFNDNVVDFTSYSALMMARLATFLDDFAEAVFAILPTLSDERALPIQSFRSGLGTLKGVARGTLEGDARGSGIRLKD